jgi:hypothetical protein
MSTNPAQRILSFISTDKPYRNKRHSYSAQMWFHTMQWMPNGISARYARTSRNGAWWQDKIPVTELHSTRTCTGRNKVTKLVQLASFHFRCPQKSVLKAATGHIFTECYFHVTAQSVHCPGYGLDNRGSILGRGRNFFSSPPRLDLLWGTPSLLSNRHQGVLSPG